MRLLRPAAGILAFYGDEALVYDTHLSVDRARWIRAQLRPPYAAVHEHNLEAVASAS